MVLFRIAARLGVILLMLATGLPAARAGEATVAAAASFAGVLSELARRFETDTGHHVVAVVGSSGKLASQILNGAPFDVFLSADQARPAAVIKAGEAEPGDRFTYAIGRLVLWSADPERLAGGGETYLKRLGTGKLSLANPKLAPYGAAAMQTLSTLGLEGRLAPRLVYGENVAQAFAMARSGAAEAGFVAWSEALSPEGAKGSSWLVPETFYTPLRQDGLLLKHGKENPAAKAFIAFLGSKWAKSVIGTHGFSSERG